MEQSLANKDLLAKAFDDFSRFWKGVPNMLVGLNVVRLVFGNSMTIEDAAEEVGTTEAIAEQYYDLALFNLRHHINQLTHIKEPYNPNIEFVLPRLDFNEFKIWVAKCDKLSGYDKKVMFERVINKHSCAKISRNNKSTPTKVRQSINRTKKIFLKERLMKGELQRFEICRDFHWL